MEQILKRIFDYQIFSPSKRLSALIEETEKRYRALDDEELSMVAAAGAADIVCNLPERKDEHIDRSI